MIVPNKLVSIKYEYILFSSVLNLSFLKKTMFKSDIKKKLHIVKDIPTLILSTTF